MSSITRDIVDMITPSMRRTDRIYGADVWTQTDKDFGEIDQLVLDLDNTKVAYALIGHGGFLRMDEE